MSDSLNSWSTDLKQNFIFVLSEIQKPTKIATRVLGLLLALSLVGILIVSIIQSDIWSEERDFRSIWISVFLIAQFPVAMVLLTAEVHVLGRILNIDVPLKDKVRISYAGSALNLLPIPGAFLTRTAYFLHSGLPVKRVTEAYLLVGFCWLFVSGILSSFAVTTSSRLVLLFLLICIFGLIAIGFRLKTFSVGISSILGLLLVEFLFALLAAMRFWLGFKTLGLSAGFRVGMAMNAAAAISSAFGIFPGGLGIREITAQFLGSQAGVTSEAASISALAARTWGLIGLFAYSSLYAVKTIVGRVRYRES